MKVDTSNTRIHAATLGGYDSHFLESVTIGDLDVLKSESPNEKGLKQLSGRGCSAPGCPWVSPQNATTKQVYESFHTHKTFDHAGEDDHYYHLVSLYQRKPLGPEGNLPSQPEGGAKETERS